MLLSFGRALRHSGCATREQAKQCHSVDVSRGMFFRKETGISGRCIVNISIVMTVVCDRVDLDQVFRDGPAYHKVY